MEEAYQIVLSKPRQEIQFFWLLLKTSKELSVTCMTTFTPKAFMIRNIAMKHWHTLTSDVALSQEFKELPLFVYKWGPNLRSRLVWASLSTGSKTLLTPLRDGSYPCGNCAQCNNTKNNLSSDSLGLEKHTVLKVWSHATENIWFTFYAVFVTKCTCARHPDAWNRE